MTGARITVEMDDAALRAAIGRAVTAMADATPLMERIGAALEGGTKRRFRDATDPQGRPWKKSLRAKLGKSGGTTLIKSGNLRDSLRRAVTADQVLVGTNQPYAAIHQFGGEITPKDAQVLAFTLADGKRIVTKKVTIPARPFLGIDDEDRATIGDVLAQYISAALDGGAA